MKIIVLLVFLVILFSLGSALLHLVRHKDQDSGKKMARALTIRISLSIALLLFIIFAGTMGWITPHSLLPVPVEGQ